MKKEKPEPRILNSAEPLDDGGRRYNKLYFIIAGILGLLLTGGGIPGIALGVSIGLLIALGIKNSILHDKQWKLRKLEFAINNKMPYPLLINKLIPVLSPLGMTVEKSSDTDGYPIITYQGMIYDIKYDENNNVFTIWWRMNLAKALFTNNSIKTYRKIVVAMGIIGYNVQQIALNSIKEQ